MPVSVRYFARLLMVAIILPLVACDLAKQPEKSNRWQWKSDASHTCSKIGGENYCFPDKDINAANFDSDAAAGFLLAIPINDNPTIMKCNAKNIELNEHTINDGRYVSLLFHAMYPGDTFEEFYKRVFNLDTGVDPILDIHLGEKFELGGMQCFKVIPPHFRHVEFLCHGGSISNQNLAYIWQCDKLGKSGEGGYPNPSCYDKLFKSGAYYGVSYNKDCMNHVQLIRKLVIEYVEAARLRGKAQAARTENATGSKGA